MLYDNDFLQFIKPIPAINWPPRIVRLHGRPMFPLDSDGDRKSRGTAATRMASPSGTRRCERQGQTICAPMRRRAPGGGRASDVETRRLTRKSSHRIRAPLRIATDATRPSPGPTPTRFLFPYSRHNGMHLLLCPHAGPDAGADPSANKPGIAGCRNGSIGASRFGELPFGRSC